MDKEKEYLINKFTQLDGDSKSYNIHLFFLEEMRILLYLAKEKKIMEQIYKVVCKVREYYTQKFCDILKMF